MDILANIKDIGEQRLYLVPDKMNPEAIFYLVLSQDDIDSPKVTLKFVKDNSGNEELQIQKSCALGFYEEQEKTDFYERLTKLAYEAKKALSRGEDLTAIDLPEHVGNLKPYDPEQIDVRDSTISVFQAYDMMKEGDINLSPDFQRNTVWDSKRKSRLIESIFLRIPLPALYFSQSKNGKLSVVDGLQRLSAIKQFMDDKLKLSELEYLTDLNGLTCSEIKGKYDLYSSRLKIEKLNINVIQPGSPTKVRYDIFRRLNTGGRPLNNQELRNCMSSPALRTALKDMAHCAEFSNATGGSISDARMEGQEMALRFMRFWDWIKNKGSIDFYKGDMETTLDAFTDEVSLVNTFPFSECVADFKRAMLNAGYLFGRHAFRKVFRGYTDVSHRLPVNKALFLAFSVVLSKYNTEEVRSKTEYGSWIEMLANAIDSDIPESMEMMKLISYGTNGVKNIKGTFAMAESFASELK